MDCSITGKKLVAKLLALQNENEELGRQLRQGRVEQYEIEIALQRKVIDELKHGLEGTISEFMICFARMNLLITYHFKKKKTFNIYRIG